MIGLYSVFNIKLIMGEYDCEDLEDLEDMLGTEEYKLESLEQDVRISKAAIEEMKKAIEKKRGYA